MGRAYQNRKESMAKTSDMKARVYSRYAREIYVSAKQGGVDPEGNLALRGLIERAKKNQVPAHVIEKALDKARGVGGEDFATARYEGFGPGGSMVIVDCLTDNPNRTFGDVLYNSFVEKFRQRYKLHSRNEKKKSRFLILIFKM